MSCVGLSALALLPQWPCEDSVRVGPPLRGTFWVRFLLGVSGNSPQPPRKGCVQAQGLVRGWGLKDVSTLLRLQGRG